MKSYWNTAMPLIHILAYSYIHATVVELKNGGKNAVVAGEMSQQLRALAILQRT